MTWAVNWMRVWLKDTQPGGFVHRAGGLHVFGYFPGYFSGLFFEDQGHFDEVLAYEPGLELVGAEDVADDEVVGALVAGFAGGFGDVEAALDDELVGFEEAGDLDGHLFPASGRCPDAGAFCHLPHQPDALPPQP